MRPVLSVQNLDVNFGARPILSQISFEIMPNQVFVLMGPGGAGKSTILRSICAVNATQQNATFSGAMNYQDSPVTPDHAPVLVVQKAHLLLGTVFENLREQSPSRVRMSPLELRQDITQFLIEMKLEDLANKLDTEVLDLSKLQRKQIMLIGALRENPALLCVDEPTADLDEQESETFLQFLREISATRAILMVTHNQRHARAIGDVICLVAGGRIQECSPIDEFFSNPKTQAARDYARTGGCSVPSLTAKPEDLEPDYSEFFKREEKEKETQEAAILEDQDFPFIEISYVSNGPSTEPGLVTHSVATEHIAKPTEKTLPFGWIRPQTRPDNPSIQSLSQDNTNTDTDDVSDTDVLAAVTALYIKEDSEILDGLAERTTPEAVAYISASRGPRNFRWLRQGSLAGTPQPGLLVDITEDFQSLKRVGVTHLITLTEEPLDDTSCKDFNIKNIHFPIVDMEAPTLEDAGKLCATVAQLLEHNATIAYHCRAGIGRTGTMLVAQLIWEGMDDKTALKNARNIYTAWVQSDVQEEFLTKFYHWVTEQRSNKPRHFSKLPIPARYRN